MCTYIYIYMCIHIYVCIYIYISVCDQESPDSLSTS